MVPLRVAYRRIRAESRDALRYFDPRDPTRDRSPPRNLDGCRRPVLLLPGFMSTQRGLSVLERRLQRDGFGVIPLNLGGFLGTFNTRSIEESALLVREKVERLYRKYDLGPLTIVGHSKGGLIGRYYIKRLGGHERACGLVTMGSPHHGSPAAYLGAALTGLFAPSIWQLMPMSSFIRKLKAGPFPGHVHFASIYSKSDTIAPFPCAMIEDRGREHLVNVEIEGVKHHEFLVRKSAYQALRTQLDRAYAFAGPQHAEASERPLRLVLDETG